MITLFRKNVGGIGSWRIWAEGSTIHIAHCTVLHGAEVHHTEDVRQGLQGRTVDEQVQMRIRSRVSRMMDKGYKATEDEARRSSNTNQMGLLRPMLAHPITRVSSVRYRGAVQQKKLNGHRCLITKQESEVIAYSRLGKPITAIQHILQPLAERIPEGTTIDGELYRHGTRLQTIASLVKALQPETSTISWVGYDLISDDRYVDRHAELKDIVGDAKTGTVGGIFVLPYEPVEDLAHALRRRDEWINHGFEGGMIRIDDVGYEVGIRSSNLIKVKKFLDGEFRVIDVVPSEKNWGVCVCLTDDGRPFKTSAPGTLEEKAEVLRNKQKYIGRMLTVEYAELTADGIPFHCSAVDWREDI